MSSDLAVARTTWLNPALRRAAILCGLLAAEVVAFTLAIDTGHLQLGPQWSLLLDAAPLAINLAIAALTGLVIFCGARWQDRATAWLSDHPQWPLFLSLHLAIVLASGLWTAYVVQQATPSDLTLAAWAILGLLVPISWCGALQRPGAWWQLLWRMAPTLVWCLLIAGAALAAGGMARVLWQPLGSLVLAMVYALLTPFGAPIVQPEQMLIGLPNFSVRIAPACSGFEGIGLVTAFVCGFWYCERKRLRFPAALLLLPLGLIAIWSANIMRIAGLIVLGEFYSSRIALGAFHSQAGWIAFNLVSLGVLFAASRWRFILKAAPTRTTHAQAGNPAAPYLAPFVTFLAVALATNALSEGPGFWYPLRALAAVGVLVWMRAAYRALDWRISWHAPALGALAYLFWVALIPTDDAANRQIAEQWAQLSPGVRWTALLLRAAGYIVVAPLVEELAFRGYLTRQLISADFERVSPGTFGWFSWLASSLIFGVAHSGFWFPAALAGGLYAVALYRRGSLGDATLAHATTNALIVIHVLVTGHWALWG